MRIVKGIVILLIAAIIALFAARSPKSVRLVKAVEQPAEGWVLVNKSLPITAGQLRFSTPLTVTDPALIVSDFTGNRLLIPQPERNKIIYHWLNLETGAEQTFEKKWDIDLPLPAAVLEGKQKTVYFLNILGELSKTKVNGQIEWQTKPFPEYLFTYENTFWLSLTGDGEWTAVISYPRQKGAAGFRTVVAEFNGDGQLLKIKEFSDLHAFNWSAKFDGTRRLITGTYRKQREARAAVRTFLLNERNEILWQGRQPFRKAAFLPEARFVILQKKKMEVIAETSGKSLYQLSAESDRIFSDLIFDQAGTLITLEGTPEYRGGKIALVNARLILIKINDWSKESIDLKEHKYLPDALKVQQPGRCLLGARDGLYQIDY